MKILRSLAFLLASVALFTSCEELEDFGIVELDMDVAAVEFVLDQQADAGEIILSEDNIETNIQELFDEHVPSGFDISRIQSIRPKNVTVKIVDETPAHDFSIVDFVELKITPDSQDEILIAQKDMTADTGTETALDLEDIDVVDYLDVESISYKATITTNEAVTAPVTLQVTGTYVIKVDLRN